MSKKTLILWAVAGAGAYFLFIRKGKAGGQTCSAACQAKGGRMLKINTKPPHYRCMIGSKMQFACLGLNSKYPGR